MKTDNSHVLRPCLIQPEARIWTIVSCNQCKYLLFLQAICEHGFTSMEESHLKVVEELQHRHQQEVERLLVERDKLLEEECAATATGKEVWGKWFGLYYTADHKEI